MKGKKERIKYVVHSSFRKLSKVLSFLSCITILAFSHPYILFFSHFRERWSKKWKMWKMYTNKFFDFLPLPFSFRNVKRVHIFIYLSLQHFFPRFFFELSLLCLLAMKSEDFQLILPLPRYQWEREREARKRANEFIHIHTNTEKLYAIIVA